MEKVLDKIKNTKILGLVGIACLVFGTMFPFVKFSIFGFSKSISLTGYWEGYAIIVMAILSIVTIFDEDVEKVLPQIYKNNIGQKIKQSNKCSLIPTAFVIIFLIYSMCTLDIDLSYASYQLGFFLLWIGSICLVAYPFVYKNDNIGKNFMKKSENVGKSIQESTDTNSETIEK